jgi:hypothetical protein
MKSKFLPHAPVPLDELARRHFDPREIDADLGRNVDQVRPAAERKHCVANLALKPRGGQVLPRAKKNDIIIVIIKKSAIGQTRRQSCAEWTGRRVRI